MKELFKINTFFIHPVFTVNIYLQEFGILSPVDVKVNYGSERAAVIKLCITSLLRRVIEEQVAQIENENECSAFLEKIKRHLTVNTDEKIPPEQNDNKEVTLLKQQLENLEKNHQEKVKVL